MTGVYVHVASVLDLIVHYHNFMQIKYILYTAKYVHLSLHTKIDIP